MEEFTEEKTPDQELIDNPFAQYEDSADNVVPVATRSIYEHISTLEPARKDTNVNRASSATNCPKRRWYQRNGAQGTPLTPRKLINFTLGDLSEMVLLYWVKESCVGEGKLYSEVDFGDEVACVEINRKIFKTYKQKTLTTKVGDLDITCHADGFGKRNSDGQWELIECKSSANWGFRSFKEEGAGDYLKQAHTVMASNECQERKISSTRYFYIRKETGHIWDRLTYFNQDIWKGVQKEFLDVLKDEEMAPPFQLIPEMIGRAPNKKPTGNYVAQFPCTYCPYLRTCQGPYQLQWKPGQDGNMKPHYVFTKKAFN